MWWEWHVITNMYDTIKGLWVVKFPSREIKLPPLGASLSVLLKIKPTCQRSAGDQCSASTPDDIKTEMLSHTRLITQQLYSGSRRNCYVCMLSCNAIMNSEFPKLTFFFTLVLHYVHIISNGFDQGHSFSP